MIFSHDSLNSNYWFDDCPMINSTIIEFAKSNKKYLFIYCDSKGEYLGEFYDNEPEEDLFIKSCERGDICGALFERDFSIIIDKDNIDSIEKCLNLIDQDIYD